MPKSESNLKLLPELDGMEHLTAQMASGRFHVHFHETFVIQLVQAGVDWCCVNEIVARDGEVFVHLPFATHSGGTLPNGSLRYEAIYPSQEIFLELTGVSESEMPIGRSYASSSPELVRATRKLFAILNSTTQRELHSAVREVFLCILQTEYEFDRDDRTDESDLIALEKFERARRYLVDNVTRDVSNDELSDYCGVSKFHLIRKFKDQFGLTPRKFLISQRVWIAKQLLIDGMPLAQAAYSAGFTDQSHFNRCFKRLTMLSPGQFRNAAINAVAL